MDQSIWKFPKWLVITILICIFVLPLLIRFSYLTKSEILTPLLLKTPLKTLVPQKTISEVKFSFVSQIPGYTIPEDSIDTSTLSYALDKLGLNPPVDKPFLGRSLTEGDRYISPKHISIIFRPIESWGTDSALDASLQKRVMLQAKITNGYKYIFLLGELNDDETNLTIPIYVNIESIQNRPLGISQYFSYYSLTALYYNLHLAPLTYEKSLVDAVLDLLGTPNIKLFEVAKSTTLLPFQIPKFYLIKPVYAGSCSGGFSAGSCGTWSAPSGYCVDLGAPYDGMSCQDNGDCFAPPDAFGTCIITGGSGTCVPGAGSGTCENCVTSGGTYYVQFTCGAGCIISYGSCGSGATPTPSYTPTPIPVCTPGSWASCGTQGCAACSSPQCNGDGSAWNCVPNAAGCCPAVPFCGDGTCNNGETCATCPADCWCPPTPSPTPTPIAGDAWYQTTGGEIYATDDLRSYVPGGIVPRMLVQDGTAGYPGVVTHGAIFPFPGYDFDGDWASYGESVVSSTNWLAGEQFTDIPFYDVFYKRFGAPIDPTSGFDQINGDKPASGVYYVQGDTTIRSPWIVNDGESIVLLIDGALTINESIQLGGTGGGFVAFITRSGITVDSGVGVAPTSTTSVLDGIYITSGTLTTGTSGAGTERLNGRGMFIADSMTFQRDLGSATNALYPAEHFTYYPRFLITMPDEMRDIPVFWQEVAP